MREDGNALLQSIVSDKINLEITVKFHLEFICPCRINLAITIFVFNFLFFSMFSQAFLSFWTCVDLFRPVWIHWNAFGGCVWKHLEPSRSVQKNLVNFQKFELKNQGLVICL